jgi:predicted PurR-regulated permease PerM
LILGVVFVLLIPAVSKTVSDLIPILKKFFTDDLPQWLNTVLKKYPQLNKSLSSYVNGGIKWDSLIPQVLDFLGSGVGAVLTVTTSLVSILSTLLMDVFVTVVFTVYCLSQKEVLARQGRKLLYACLREDRADEIVRVLRMTNSTFSNFLSGQCIEVVILGSMFAVSMAIFKMPYIPLISVLIAVTAFIPIVGAFIGCIVGAFLIFVHDPLQAVAFVRKACWIFF